jgi:NADPH:quinone reductase-like Zn-dependent oxidoreductase
MNAMKAATYESYGAPEDVLRVVDVPRPEPGEDEVLVRIAAASVNYLDVNLMRGKPRLARLAFGWPRPKVTRPGVDFAGTVEAVGARVSRFAPGDEVFGACRGSFAEYGCTTEARIAAKPATISFAEAAAIPVAGLTALQGLRDHGRVGPGQKVLVNGAGGGIGTFAIQIARVLGAEVTAVCSAAKAELARSLGAVRAIDYAKEDFTRTARGLDVLFDVAASHSFRRYRRVLKPGGIVVAAGMVSGGGEPGTLQLIGFARHMLAAFLTSKVTAEKFAIFMAKAGTDDLAWLAGQAAAGTIRPVIDRSYKLEDAALAMRHVAGGHAAGKVIVEIP